MGGTLTSDVFALDSAITAPPPGAVPFNVTVPVAGVPPGTFPLNRICPRRGNSDTSAFSVVPPYVPEILTTVAAVTALEAIGKVAVVWPAGTVTLAGIETGTVPEPPLAKAFDNVTTAPVEGAAAVRATLPVADAPPTIESGAIVTLLSVVAPPGVISSNAWRPGLPARCAKIFKLNCDVTGDVVIVKLALVAPAGTVTVWQRDDGGHGGSLDGNVAGAVSMIDT